MNKKCVFCSPTKNVEIYLSNSIELIVNGYKPNSKDVGQYIDTIKRVAFKFPEHYSRDVFGTDRAELVADEFHKAYKKFYKSE